MKNHGSSAVETAIGMAAMITTLMGGLPLLYLAFAKSWVRHQAYENLICLAELKHPAQCEGDFIEAVRVLPIGKLVKHHYTVDLDQLGVVGKFEISGLQLGFRQTLLLPLRPK